MSFALELHAELRDWQEAERAAAATAFPGHLPVYPGRRTRWRRALTPSIHFGEIDAVFSDDAHWGEDAFSLSPAGRRDLAATVLALAQVLDPGWGIRACWGGDPINGEQMVTARQLAELVRRSRLDRCTLYRVRLVRFGVEELSSR